MQTMAEWFGLKEGHTDFTIENDVNSDLFFARQELNEQLARILRKSFRTDNPPKMVLYGDWGVGKTHTLRHIEYVIKTTPEYVARTVYIELPDVTAKSTFQVAHASLLDALGFDVVKGWVGQFHARHVDDALPVIQELTQSGDIAKAFLTLGTYGDSARIAWDWLRGLSLSAADSRSVGLSPVLEQSLAFVNVLRTVGRLSEEIENETLVFLIDEAEKLENVSNGDAINHWLNALKVLSDPLTKDVGLVLAASFRDPDDMPNPLADQQVRGRFSEEHYIRLDNFDLEDTHNFVSALLEAWVDPEEANRIWSEYGDEADGETKGLHPFTQDGLELFVDHACRLGVVTTPRDAQKTLDDVLNRAIDDERRIISRVYLTSQLSVV